MKVRWTIILVFVAIVLSFTLSYVTRQQGRPAAPKAAVEPNKPFEDSGDAAGLTRADSLAPTDTSYTPPTDLEIQLELLEMVKADMDKKVVRAVVDLWDIYGWDRELWEKCQPGLKQIHNEAELKYWEIYRDELRLWDVSKPDFKYWEKIVRNMEIGFDRRAEVELLFITGSRKVD